VRIISDMLGAEPSACKRVWAMFSTVDLNSSDNLRSIERV